MPDLLKSEPSAWSAIEAPLTAGVGKALTRILVTDDRPEQLQRIDAVLGNLFTCEFASSVEEARSRLGAGAFELAVCDVHAQGERGLALADEIIENHLDTAVVLVTREEDLAVARRAFALGVHGYLVEPLHGAQLLITVTNALKRRNSDIAARAQRLNLEERFQTIIDMAPIPIYVKDTSHHYVIANAKADQMAGVRRGKLVGRADASIMSPGATESASGVEERVLGGGSIFDAEELMVTEGVERTYETVKFPIIDPQSQITGVCGISIDVTGQREALRLRDEMAAAQEQAIEELRVSRQETVERLTKAIELHDGTTWKHVSRMAEIASFIGDRIGLSPELVRLLRVAAAMHDVGKIGVPAAILCKPGPLTDEERREMTRHTVVGHEILSNSDSKLLQMAAVIALTHHEWYDGSGYPQGLAGEQIPIEGRVSAVADVFDALLSDRCYRPAMPLADVIGLMEEGRGTHFDPRVVDALLDNVDEALALRTSRSEPHVT
jgi:PAS domain S-box-containing protein